MKKTFCITIIILAVSLFFTACSDDEKVNLIEERLDKLERAINRNDYNAFKSCFHSESNYMDSYTETNFEYFGDLTYNFWDRNITIIEETDEADEIVQIAKVDCMAEVDDGDELGPDDYETYFELKQADGKWKILLWQEEEVDIFQSIAAPQ